MLSLTNESGTPVSTFGTGVAFSNSQTQVNPATFSNTSLFGSLGGNGSGGSGNAAAISPTRPGSTAHIGYTDPAASARRGASATPMNPVAPPASTGGTQGTSTAKGPGIGEAVQAISKRWGPQEQPNEAKTPTPPPPSPSTNGRAIGEGLYNAGQAAASRIGTFAHAASSARPRQQRPSGLFSATTGLAGDLEDEV